MAIENLKTELIGDLLRRKHAETSPECLQLIDNMVLFMKDWPPKQQQPFMEFTINGQPINMEGMQWNTTQ